MPDSFSNVSNRLPDLDQFSETLKRDLFPSSSGVIGSPYERLDVAQDLSAFLSQNIPIDKTSEARLHAIVEKLSTEIRWVLHWATVLTSLDPKFDSSALRREHLERQLESLTTERDKIEARNDSGNHTLEAHDRTRFDSIKTVIANIENEIDSLNTELDEHAAIKDRVDAGNSRLVEEIQPVIELYIANHYDVEKLVRDEFEIFRGSCEERIAKVEQTRKKRNPISPGRIIDWIRIRAVENSIPEKLEEIRKKHLLRVYPQLYKLSGIELSFFAIELLRRKYKGEISSENNCNSRAVIIRCEEVWRC